MKAKNLYIPVAMLFGGCLAASAQNITDLAVMNDKSADKVTVQTNVSTIDSTVFIHPDRIRYTDRCLVIDGEPQFLYSGAFHYFRVPKELWADRMHKLKEAGFNCVETYIPWNWHEREMPKIVNDLSKLDMTDFEDFLDLADAESLNVIVRPGPYICAEWDGGGFPQWIMQKKPKKTLHDVWLQSNDPEFVKWNKHWYDAVCKVVEPRQITRRPKGSTGVILFQIENEFNRIKWFPKEEKKAYLENLATLVRDNGIDVPIFTCWTSEARNVMDGPLNGVFDMVNSYPKWQVEKNFGRLINQQLNSQPGKPLFSGELQGGWMSEVGGKMSWDQEGLTPVQTQNITLYALQRGFGGLNYYMAVGGANFDDWGARQMTQTYDYAAAIGENGYTNDRYRRMKGMAKMLKEHGVAIANADPCEIECRVSDPDVKVALRQAANGDRYYFVRTEEHTDNHFGTVIAEDVVFDYALEPFGSMVYYLPNDAKEGKWLPELPVPESRPLVKADTIHLQAIQTISDPLPREWNKLKKGEMIDNKGINSRHPVYYRVSVSGGAELKIGLAGDKLINGTDGDNMLVVVDGRLLEPTARDQREITFVIPGEGKKEVMMLFENKGLQHHTNAIVEEYWAIGPKYVRVDRKDIPLEYAYEEKERGISLSNGINISTGSDNPLMNWTVFSFSTPDIPENVTLPLYLSLNHTGNGFIYVNGRCLGRCYEKGPQTDYWLPETWLNKDGDNTIAISLLPVAPSHKAPSVISASIVPQLFQTQYKK